MKKRILLVIGIMVLLLSNAALASMREAAYGGGIPSSEIENMRAHDEWVREQVNAVIQQQQANLNELNDAQQIVVAKNGWQVENDSWYYYENNTKVTSKWVKYDNDWYYLDPLGKMLTNSMTPDGYYVDANGKWVH